MKGLAAIAAAVLTSLVVSGGALAQQTGPLTDRDVVGDWALVITPAERRGMQINVELDDDDLPLTITRRSTNRLTCVLDDAPARCHIRDGELIVVMPTGSGGASLVFTIDRRIGSGFGGAARLTVRFLPLGGHIGSVAMTRR